MLSTYYTLYKLLFEVVELQQWTRDTALPSWSLSPSFLAVGGTDNEQLKTINKDISNSKLYEEIR